jgi:acetyl-CoA acetyltransferase
MSEHIQKYSRSDKEKKKKSKSFKEKIKDYKDIFEIYMVLQQWIDNDTLKKRRKFSSGDHSPFMDVYGFAARQHMKKYGSTIEQLAVIASKNHFHSSLNPNAQYTFNVTKEQVLADRLVTWPFTRAMCAPIGDGAASAILCDGETVKQLGLTSQAVKVRASILGSGRENRHSRKRRRSAGTGRGRYLYSHTGGPFKVKRRLYSNVQ